MRLAGRSRDETVELLTSKYVTRTEAAFFADLIRAEQVEDTNQISPQRWVELSSSARLRTQAHDLTLLPNGTHNLARLFKRYGVADITGVPYTSHISFRNELQKLLST